MLDWPIQRYVFTLGFGSFALTGLLAELWEMSLPGWAVVAVVMLPMSLIVFFQAGDNSPKIVRIAQKFAALWYVVLFILSVDGMIWFGPAPKGWPFYIAVAALGLIPSYLILAQPMNRNGKENSKSPISPAIQPATPRCFACESESAEHRPFEDAAWLCPACDEIFQWGRKGLADELAIEPEMITPRTRFAEDLGIDSLDLTEFRIEIEKRYGAPVGCEWGVEGNRVADVIAYIRAHRATPPA